MTGRVGWTRRWLLSCVASLVLLAVVMPQAARADGASTWYVTTAVDDASGDASNCSAVSVSASSDCSLRDAFAAAQPGDTIAVELPQADQSTPLELTSSLSLTGAGAYPDAVTLKLNGATLEPDAGISLEQYALTIDGPGTVTVGSNLSSGPLLQAQWGSALDLNGSLLVSGVPYDDTGAWAPNVEVNDNGDPAWDTYPPGNPQPGELSTAGGVIFANGLSSPNVGVLSNDGVVSLGQTEFQAGGVYAQGGTLDLGAGNSTVSFDDNDYGLQGCDVYQFQGGSGDTTVTTSGTVKDESGTCLGTSSTNPPSATAVTVTDNTTDQSQVGNAIYIGVGEPLTLDAVVCPEDPSSGSCPSSSSPPPPAGTVRFGVRPLDDNNQPSGIGTTLGSAGLTAGANVANSSDSQNVSALDGSLATLTHTFTDPGSFDLFAGFVPASGVSAPASADAFSVSSATSLQVLPEPAVALSSSSGQNSGACQNAGTSDGNLVSGQCTDVSVQATANNPANYYPGQQTLSLTYDDGTGSPQTQTSSNSGGSQTSSADFALVPDDHGGVLTGTFTGQDGVFGTASASAYVPGLALATIAGKDQAVCAGQTADPSAQPLEGTCSDEQLTLSSPTGAPSFDPSDQVVLTYTPGDGGPTQTLTKANLSDGVIDFGVTPSASTGSVSAVFTSSSGDLLDFSTSAELDASQALEPTVSTSVAKGQGFSACAGIDSDGDTTAAAYIAQRCSEVDVTIAPPQGDPPLNGGTDTVQVIPQDSSGNQQGSASDVQTLPSGDGAGGTLAYGVVPNSSATQLDIHYTSGGGIYGDSDTIVPISVGSTPAPNLSFTTTAGSSNTSVCDSGPSTTTAAYVRGECSIVTVHLSDPSGDAGRAFTASQDSVTLTYDDDQGNQISQQTASVDASGDGVFAVTPDTSAVDLSASSSSADGGYAGGAATATSATAANAPAPTVSVQVLAGSGSSVCASAPVSAADTQMVVGKCSEVAVTVTPAAGAPAIGNDDTVTLDTSDPNVAEQTATLSNGAEVALFAVTPSQSGGVSLTGNWTPGQMSAYVAPDQDASGSVNPSVNPTTPQSITITTAPGRGSSVCAGAAKQSYTASFTVGSCSAVTVTVTPQPGVPLSQRANIHSYPSGKSEADSITLASSSGQPTSATSLIDYEATSDTFAVTPGSSSFTLSAQYQSNDPATYDTNSSLAANQTVASETAAPLPTPTIQTAVAAGAGTSACASSGAAGASATLAVGQCDVLNISVTPPSGAPALASGDSVTVIDTDAQGTASTTTATLSNGQAHVVLTPLTPTGNYEVSFNSSGDPSYGATSTSTNYTATPIASTVALSASPNPAQQTVEAGTPITLTATLNPASYVPTNTPLPRIRFDRSDGASVTVPLTSASGVISAQTTVTPLTGTVSYTASVVPDSAGDTPSFTQTGTSSVGPVSIVARPTTLNLSASASAVAATQVGAGTTAASTSPVTVNASASSDSGSFVPTGTIALINGAGTHVGSITLSNGSGSTQLTGLTPDLGPLTASYAGDSTVGAANATTPLQVGYTPVTVSANAPATAPEAQTSVPVTGTVTATTGSAAPGGTVTVSNGNTVLGTGTVTPAASGTSSSWSVTLPNGLNAGNQSLTISFSDAEHRFAAAQTSLAVAAVAGSSTCYTVSTTSPSVPTRVNGVLSQAPVLTTASTQDQCTIISFTGGLLTPTFGVKPGGTETLTAIPPAFEQVTGFTVTAQSGGTTTVPVNGVPGAGQTATATITVTGPVSVTPITVQAPGTCVPLKVQQQWLAANQSPEGGLGSFTVSGAIGCSVTASTTTQTLSSGATVTALPGTPITVVSNGTRITSAAGDDTSAYMLGLPIGSSTPAWNSATLPMPSISTIVTSYMKMNCEAAPTLEQSTGGAVTQTIPNERGTVLGQLTQVLTATGTTATSTSTTAKAVNGDGNAGLFYSMQCPVSWGGSGLVPGTSISYTATPSSKSSGANQVGSWGVDSFQEVDSSSGTSNSSLITGFTTNQLAPANATSQPTGAAVTHTFTLPAGLDSTSLATQPVAVGFRFTELTCEPVVTDVASTGRSTAGVSGSGQYINGQLVTVGQVNGSLAVSPAPNCTQAGADDYAVGTQLSVTATDPQHMANTIIRTAEQQPGAYTGTTDTDLYTGDGSTSANRVAAARRTARAGTGSVSGDQAASGVLASSAVAVTAAKTKRHKGKPGTYKGSEHAPVHKPSSAPSPARLVPNVANTVNRAQAALRRSDRAASAAKRTVKSLRAEVRTRLADLAATVDATHPRLGRETAAYMNWMHAVVNWWGGESAALKGQVASAKAQLKQLQTIAAAQYAAAGSGLSYAAYDLAGQQGEVRLQTTLASDDAARASAIAAAVPILDRAARVLHGSVKLRRTKLTAAAQATNLRTLVHELRIASARQRAMLGTQTKSLTRLSKNTSRRDARQLTAVMAKLHGKAMSQPAWHGRKLRHGAARVRTRAVAKSAHRGAVRTDLARAQSVSPTGVANGRGLYPDEQIANYGSSSPMVYVPQTYQGIYADSNVGGTSTSATASPVIAGTQDHQTTITVPTTPLAIHATWGPSSCEVPTIDSYDKSQMAVSVDGGADACAGPGTVARLGTFAVDVEPFVNAVPIVVVSGLNPSGTEETRVQVGSAQTFPALANTSVNVQLCEPLEFGGAVTDINHNDANNDGSTLLDSSEIDEFATAPAGSECAIPGYYKVGTKVSFSLPNYLQEAVSSRTVDNASLENGFCQEGSSSGDDQCAQKVPAAGSTDWEVDGVDVGSSPPSVTLSANDPQHEVGLEENVSCDRLEVAAQSNSWDDGYQQMNWGGDYSYTVPQSANPPALDDASDCPVNFADEGSNVTTVKSGNGDSNYLGTTTGYYLAGDTPEFESATAPNGGGCNDDSWSGLQTPQPNEHASWDLNNTWTSDLGPYYAYFSGSDTSDYITEQYCHGYMDVSSNCWDINCELDTLVNDDLLPNIESYIVDPAIVFYKRLKQFFTTNPITNPGSFFSQLGEFGVMFVAADLGLGPAFVTAAGDSDFFSSPGAFLNQIEQTGRIAAAQDINTTFTAAQVVLDETGVGEVLAGGDLLIQLTASELAKYGAPNSVVQAIEYGRAVTNGLNALSNCSSEAAAGDTPPQQPPSSTGSDLGKGVTVGKGIANYGEPSALTTLGRSLTNGATMSEATSTFASNVSSKLNNSKLSFVLGQVSVLHDYDGANVDWTPTDYSDCLAENTFG